MSEKVAIPLIAPGSEGRVREMFEQSIKRHQHAVKVCQTLIDKELDSTIINYEEQMLIDEALEILITNREESIAVLQQAITELEQV
jgi:hypothetical protein